MRLPYIKLENPYNLMKKMTKYYRVYNKMTTQQFDDILDTITVVDVLDTFDYILNEDIYNKVFVDENKYIKTLLARKAKLVKDIQQLEYFVGLCQRQSDCEEEEKIYKYNIDTLIKEVNDINKQLGEPLYGN